jgi:hypothetical protein
VAARVVGMVPGGAESALGVLEATGGVPTVLTLRSKTPVPLAVAPIQFGPSGSLGRSSPLSAVNRHVRS